MNYRRLGRSEAMVSEIGFGTCQLRMVPATQAVQTLITGFKLGVNIVHTAPDYGGAQEIVAEAIKYSRCPVYVCSNGWGSQEYFQFLFESTREQFGRRNRSGRVALDFFGIASVEDREILGENVWNDGGMVEFLTRMKREGSLHNIFCTSHGSPAYIRRLIESNIFDAVMFAYNPLGYHMLTFNPPDNREREAVLENKQLFEIAAKHDVGVMLMEVLGGGLLCESRTFPVRGGSLNQEGDLPKLPRASEILKYILRSQQSIACLLPGTVSVEEAQENALASQSEIDDDRVMAERIGTAVAHLQHTTCCRCGYCDDLCSRDLPLSWLFRAGDIARRGAVPFETPQGKDYFDLHPVNDAAACRTCNDRTCDCPYGIDIPTQLTGLHSNMLTLLARGEVPGPSTNSSNLGSHAYDAHLVSKSWNGEFATVVVQNVGVNGWHLSQSPSVWIELRNADASVKCPMRSDVPVASCGYFTFDLPDSILAILGELWIVFRSETGGAIRQIILGHFLTEAESLGTH